VQVLQPRLLDLHSLQPLLLSLLVPALRSYLLPL